MTDRTPEPWETRAKALAEAAFNRATERREQDAALAEQERDLRHAIKEIDERLKGIPSPTHDPQLLEERDELLRHRGELSRELETLSQGPNRGPNRDRRHDLSR